MVSWVWNTPENRHLVSVSLLSTASQPILIPRRDLWLLSDSVSVPSLLAERFDALVLCVYCQAYSTIQHTCLHHKQVHMPYHSVHRLCVFCREHM